MVLSKTKLITLILSAVISVNTFAANTIWNFETDKPGYNVVNSGVNFGNTLTIDKDSDGQVDLTITAWSDTGCGWGCGDDSKIDSAYASTNNYGLLNYNKDTQNGTTGENHVIDNYDGDTDMMLFKFDDIVALTGINLGWVDSDSDISIAAFSAMPSLTGNTWSAVVSQAIYSASFADIGSGFSSLVNEVGGVVVEAQYWLIGAYNSAFSNLSLSNDNDGFKLAALTTIAKETPSPDTVEVPEPSTLSVFASFGLILLWRRMQKS